MPLNLPAVVVIILLAATVLSFGLVGWRCRPGRGMADLPERPPVSIIRPLAGIENYLDEALRSNFALDYPEFEILFCVDRMDDPVIPLVRRLIAEHPDVDARLLVGEEHFCANPKLNNLLKGWSAARHDLTILADSNVLMPRDYIQKLLLPLTGNVVVTFSPPIGARPESFWAEVECAFLNSFQARVLYGGDTLRLRPIQGKSMMLRRSWLDALGGLRALSTELAEDIALRKIILATKAQTRIVDVPFEQLLGRRSAREVIERQRRWAVLRRLAAPQFYVLELLLSGVTLVALAVLTLGGDPLAVAVGTGAIVYGSELATAWRLGWLHSWRAPLALVLRDLLLPVIWVCGIFERGYRWREFRVVAGGGKTQMIGGRS